MWSKKTFDRKPVLCLLYVKVIPYTCYLSTYCIFAYNVGVWFSRSGIFRQTDFPLWLTQGGTLYKESTWRHGIPNFWSINWMPVQPSPRLPFRPLNEQEKHFHRYSAYWSKWGKTTSYREDRGGVDQRTQRSTLTPAYRARFTAWILYIFTNDNQNEALNGK